MADEQRISEIKERLELATLGEWGVNHDWQLITAPSNRGARAILKASPNIPVRESRFNLEFVAHAKSDISYLLSEVERLSAPGYKDTRDPTTCPRCRHPRHGGECAKVISRDVNWVCRCSYVNGSAPSGETGEG